MSGDGKVFQGEGQHKQGSKARIILELVGGARKHFGVATVSSLKREGVMKAR